MIPMCYRALRMSDEGTSRGDRIPEILAQATRRLTNIMENTSERSGKDRIDALHSVQLHTLLLSQAAMEKPSEMSELHIVHASASIGTECRLYNGVWE